jgi:hypothetical protein
MVDTLVQVCPFQVCAIVDNVSRVSPAIAVGSSIKGNYVVVLLDYLKATVGRPKRLG